MSRSLRQFIELKRERKGRAAHMNLVREAFLMSIPSLLRYGWGTAEEDEALREFAKSRGVFASAWNNPEDARYDDLP